MMTRRSRLPLVGALVLAMLLFAGFMAWQYVSQAREYKRLVAFDEAATRLYKVRASSEEVQRALGEPAKISEGEGTILWHYDPGYYKGHRQARYVFYIDSTTRRVVNLSYTTFR